MKLKNNRLKSFFKFYVLIRFWLIVLAIQFDILKNDLGKKVFSRMNQVKFLKDCFPQILFGPFLKILSHLYLDHFCDLRLRMLMKGQLGLISSMRVDDRKDIQSVKSAWSVLHTGFKAHILFLVEGNNKEYFLSPDMYTYVCVSDAQY